MTGRLPPAGESEIAGLAEVFAEIKASRGFVSNAMRSLGHAPEGLRRYAAVGRYVKYETDLPERLRELSILCAARGVPYAWAHHSALAVQAGIPTPAVDDIAAGRVPAVLPESERAIVRFVAEMLGAGVNDATAAELSRHFTPRQVTDIAMSAAYYRAFGAMASALGAEIEPPEILRVERDWQKGRR